MARDVTRTKVAAGEGNLDKKKSTTLNDWPAASKFVPMRLFVLIKFNKGTSDSGLNRIMDGNIAS